MSRSRSLPLVARLGARLGLGARVYGVLLTLYHTCGEQQAKPARRSRPLPLVAQPGARLGKYARVRGALWTLYYKNEKNIWNFNPAFAIIKLSGADTGQICWKEASGPQILWWSMGSPLPESRGCGSYGRQFYPGDAQVRPAVRSAGFSLRTRSEFFGRSFQS